MGEFFDEFCDVIGGTGESGMGKVINAVAEAITLDFLVNGERTVLLVVVEFHLGSIEAGFAIDKIADGGVFDDHFGPERIARKAEEIGAFVGGDFDDDIGPAG